MSASLSKPRVLLLNMDFPPDSSDTARVVVDVAEALSDGSDVTVLAGRPFYSPSERHPFYLLRRGNHGRIRVNRVGSFAFDRRSMLGRTANYLTYMFLALVRGVTLKPDLVIAMTSPPLAGLIGAIIASIWRRPFVYNIRDMHPDTAVAAGVIRDGFLVSVWEKVHKWVLRRADKIVVLGEDMKERVIAKGISPGRVAVVRNGAPPAEALHCKEHPVVKAVRCEYPFVVLHGGNLGFAGAWDSILESARRLEDQQAGFVFVGDGAYRRRIEEASSQLANVRLMHFFSENEIPYVLSAPDLQIVTLKAGLEGFLVPGKLYPILWSGRPVLAIAPEGSDVVRIVKEYECGLVADPDDPDAIAAAVTWALDHPEDIVRMGIRAREAARDFERSALLRDFVDVVESLERRRNDMDC